MPLREDVLLGFEADDEPRDDSRIHIRGFLPCHIQALALKDCTMLFMVEELPEDISQYLPLLQEVILEIELVDNDDNLIKAERRNRLNMLRDALESAGLEFTTKVFSW